MDKDILRDVGWLARAINIKSNQTFLPLGLAKGQFIYVIRVIEAPGIGQDELARSIGIDRTTAFRAVAKLIAAGYIEKRAHPTQARQKVLYPTTQGQAIYGELHAYEMGMVAAAAQGFTPEEATQLTVLLARMKENMADYLKD